MHLNDELNSEEVAKLREGLNSLPDLKAPESLQNPSSEMFNALSELEESTDSKRQVEFWRRTSFALAASLFLVLGLVGYSGLNNDQRLPQTIVESPKAGQSTASLTMLIEMNQILQREIESSTSLIKVVSRQKKYLHRKLDKIDDAIQQAYLSRLSEQEKFELWQERLSILKALEKQNAVKKSKKTIRI